MTTRRTFTDFSIAAILAREEPRSHILHQQTSGTLFPCGSCKKLFTSSLFVERHQKFCSARNGPHLTEDLEPTDISSLGRICDGTTVYYCPFCTYYSTHCGHMKYHLATHTGVRPFKCDVCGKTFTRGSNLTTHRRIHTGDRPYKCNKCSYMTVSSSNLAIHKRTHTGERLYKCDLCYYRATQKKTLTSHIARIHKQKD